MSIPQQGGGPIERPEQLAEYLASGCKPRDQWRIGTEHEKFGYRLSDRKPLPYDGPCSIRAGSPPMRAMASPSVSPSALVVLSMPLLSVPAMARLPTQDGP